jgi:hypothetical protein
VIDTVRVGDTPANFGNFVVVPIPEITIATNQSVYHGGDRLTVTVTTERNGSFDPWYLGIALSTPFNTPDNPFFVYRYAAGPEFLPWSEVQSLPASQLSARPPQQVADDSFVMLDVVLPPGVIPTGPYEWFALHFLDDFLKFSGLSSAPFSVQP